MYGARISDRGRGVLGGAELVGRPAVTGALTDEIVRLVRVLKAAVPVGTGPDRSALLLLSLLVQEGPMRLRELADAKGADPSTVSRQAAQLVRAGLVRSDTDPADGRARRLAVTAAGRQACRRMLEARCRAVDEALGGWSDAKLTRFTALFREFNGLLESQAQQQIDDMFPHQRQETH
jgi:DNA-binding MarR family transcriptional regulator